MKCHVGTTDTLDRILGRRLDCTVTGGKLWGTRRWGLVRRQCTVEAFGKLGTGDRLK